MLLCCRKIEAACVHQRLTRSEVHTQTGARFETDESEARARRGDVWARVGGPHPRRLCGELRALPVTEA